MGDQQGFGRSLTGTLDGLVVHVAVVEAGLVLWTDETAPDARSRWGFGSCTWSWDPSAPGERLVVEHGGARLEVADGPALLTRVERYGPEATQNRARALWTEAAAVTERHPATHAAILVALVLVCVGLWHGMTWVESFCVDTFVPMSFEAGIGKQFEPDLVGGRANAPAEVTAAVQAITDRLVAAWPPERRETFGPYVKVRVVMEPMMNAFALPGGHIIVMSGLLSQAERPDQVAAVIAHELTHVAERDSMKRLAGQIKWTLLRTYLAGDMGADHEFVFDRVQSLSSLRYSRTQEERADREGLLLMRRAGFDSAAASELFTIMLGQGPNVLDQLNFLSDHPATPRRIDDLRKLHLELEASGPPAPQAPPLPFDWQRIRSLVAGGRSSDGP